MDCISRPRLDLTEERPLFAPEKYGLECPPDEEHPAFRKSTGHAARAIQLSPEEWSLVISHIEVPSRNLSMPPGFSLEESAELPGISVDSKSIAGSDTVPRLTHNLSSHGRGHVMSWDRYYPYSPEDVTGFGSEEHFSNPQKLTVPVRPSKM